MSKDLTWPVTAAVRALIGDAVQHAHSGHPGTPMGMAEIAAILWRRFLKHNPSNPDWVDRDRFVLSNGHASALLYAVLHLTGYDLPMEEIKRFRKLHSKTPGHPEYGVTPGVDTSTGPLGQGFANAVGMAIAERTLAAQFNRGDNKIVDHRTWVSLGDGCLMEGISHEAASLAGHLGLHKLIAIYDDNGVTIDGKTSGWLSDDTPKRFESYGWYVIRDVDGHDTEAISDAFERAVQVLDKPVLICAKTVIGRGAPNKEGSEVTHGSPLGEDELQKMRDAINWKHPPFEIPPPVYQDWDCREKGKLAEQSWKDDFATYEKEYPDLASEFKRRMLGEMPEDFDELLESKLIELNGESDSVATRRASQIALDSLGAVLPELFGGSCDLASSNLTNHTRSVPITTNVCGNTIHYGVREFAMTGIANGIALHRGFIPFGATFLVFSDYSRNAIRMSALMRLRVIHVYTHDSICVGEDGPTHQPVEHIWSLRLIPDLSVWRPCDRIETFVAWSEALKCMEGPSALLFSRQKLPDQVRTKSQISDIKRGGYLLLDRKKEGDSVPQVLIISTGSEVHLAVSAAERLSKNGIGVTVVSMPCVEAFERQDEAYRNTVLPPGVPKIALEAGSSGAWWKYVGNNGIVLSVDSFGHSGPQKELYDLFGFTVDNVVDAALNVLKAR